MLFVRPTADPGVRPARRRALPDRAGLARSRRSHRSHDRGGAGPHRRHRRSASTASPCRARVAIQADPAGIAIERRRRRPSTIAAMVLTAKDYIAAGDIFQVVLAQRFTTPVRAAAVRALSRAAAHQSLAVPLFPRPARLRADRLDRPRSSSACATARSRSARSPAPARAARPSAEDAANRESAARRSQGTRRASDAARPRPQRRRPRRRRRAA